MVIVDDKAKMKLERFNKNIYANIEEIAKLLISSMSKNNEYSVYILNSEVNRLEIVCNNNEEKFNLKLEARDDFFNDRLTIEDECRLVEYEFNKNDKGYFLKPLRIQEKNKENVICELSLYSYGKHIDIYFNNRIFSFDLQKPNISFDFSKFKEIVNNTKTLELASILQIIQACIDSGEVRILADEYFNNKLVKSIDITNKVIKRARVLKFKGKKC